MLVLVLVSMLVGREIRRGLGVFIIAFGGYLVGSLLLLLGFGYV